MTMVTRLRRGGREKIFNASNFLQGGAAVSGNVGDHMWFLCPLTRGNTPSLYNSTLVFTRVVLCWYIYLMFRLSSSSSLAYSCVLCPYQEIHRTILQTFSFW